MLPPTEFAPLPTVRLLIVESDVPTNEVDVNAPVLELNLRLVFVCGSWLLVAAWEKIGKHSVSLAWFVNVKLVAVVAGPSNDVAVKTVNDVCIYPNPTNDIVNIDAKGNNQYLSATVYDIFGKLLINTKSTKISLNKFDEELIKNIDAWNLAKYLIIRFAVLACFGEYFSEVMEFYSILRLLKMSSLLDINIIWMQLYLFEGFQVLKRGYHGFPHKYLLPLDSWNVSQRDIHQ